MNITKHIGRPAVLSAFFFLIMGSGSVSVQAADEMNASQATSESIPNSVAEPDLSIASGVAATDLKPHEYALVNGTPITFNQYNAELVSLLKARFYHGRVSKEKGDAVRKELTNTMIDRVLMVQEADQQGIKPDEKYVERIIASWERKGKLDGPEHDQLVSQIRDIEGKRSQINQLEAQLKKSVPPPTAEEVRAYYDSHLDLFTQPVQMRLSVILVGADPSVPSDWVTAYGKAQDIYEKLKNGADFAEMARNVSTDKSAAKGGDLGYLHHGMLPRGLEDKVDKFQVGVVTEPIKMLEGWSIFRLEDRIPPLVSPYDRSRERAQQLLIRDNQEKAVKDNIERLRKTAKIEISDKILF